jgi:hypothetical protein
MQSAMAIHMKNSRPMKNSSYGAGNIRADETVPHKFKPLPLWWH